MFCSAFALIKYMQPEIKMQKTDLGRILIATRNPGKLAEIRELVAGIPVEVFSLDDMGITDDVEETGVTFEENAVLKARAYASAAGMPALADDSGLEVAALGGAPGVFSSRYAGAETAYPQKMERLMKEIAESGSADRSARFVCSMALADPKGNILFSGEGICQGTLAKAPRGSGGFGYDPLFVPEGCDLTFAELSAAIKNEIGHRARAAKLFVRYLLDFIGD